MCRSARYAASAMRRSADVEICRDDTDGAAMEMIAGAMRNAPCLVWHTEKRKTRPNDHGSD